MQVRVELVAGFGWNLGHAASLQNVEQILLDVLDPGDPRRVFLFLWNMRRSPVKIVDNRQQVFHESGEGELGHLLALGVVALALIVQLGQGAPQVVIGFGQTGFQRIAGTVAALASFDLLNLFFGFFLWHAVVVMIFGGFLSPYVKCKVYLTFCQVIISLFYVMLHI